MKITTLLFIDIHVLLFSGRLLFMQQPFLSAHLEFVINPLTILVYNF